MFHLCVPIAEKRHGAIVRERRRISEELAERR